VRYAKSILAAAVTAAIVVTGGVASAAPASSRPGVIDVKVVGGPKLGPGIFRPIPRVPVLLRKQGHAEMRGYAPSVYRGKYYRAAQEGYRECVMWRESRHRYGLRNQSGSSAAGAYQFLDNSWRKRSGSLPWMMHAENKQVYGKEQAKKILRTLQTSPIERWGRAWQDQAFFTALNYNGTWSGKKHWNATVPGTGC
jgi:hypothetical protein